MEKSLKDQDEKVYNLLSNNKDAHSHIDSYAWDLFNQCIWSEEYILEERLKASKILWEYMENKVTASRKKSDEFRLKYLSLSSTLDIKRSFEDMKEVIAQTSEEDLVKMKALLEKMLGDKE